MYLSVFSEFLYQRMHMKSNCIDSHTTQDTFYPANFNMHCFDRNPSLYMNITKISRVFQESYIFLA